MNVPERHGPNRSADILKVNIAAIAGIILGGWLIKNLEIPSLNFEPSVNCKKMAETFSKFSKHR